MAYGAPGSDMRGHYGSVNAICAFDADEGVMIASAGDDVAVRLWKPGKSGVRDGLTGHGDWVTSLAIVERLGHRALASADKNGTIRLWDTDGRLFWNQRSHHDAVNALCATTVAGLPAIASAGAEGTVRLWSTKEGRPLAVLAGHTASATSVCTMPYGDREIIVSTSLDRTVRLWDPVSEQVLRTIPVHHPALSCLYLNGTLVIGLDQGLLGPTGARDQRMSSRSTITATG